MYFRLRRLVPCMILIMLLPFFMPNRTDAEEQVKVIVLPFSIHALAELSYLTTEIPKVIGDHLKQDGAKLLDTTIDPEGAKQMILGGEARIRNFGIESGADHVIWGSLTWIGGKFSLDAKAIAARGGESSDVFYGEGEGIENLLGTVKNLSRDLSVKLFKLEKVAEIRIVGNRRIEADAIKRVIETEVGGIYLSRRVPQDIKAVYAMGYFDDIRVEVSDVPLGKSIVFTVKEKATIRQVLVQGNKVYEDDQIMEELDVKTGAILNIFKIQTNISRIVQLYKDKNYHGVDVQYTTRPLKNNQADLIFVIKEGTKLLIKEIRFEGNSDYTDKELKGVMKNTSEKGFFSFITSSGDLKMEDLEEDVQRLFAHYHKAGYIGARIGEPIVEYGTEWIYVTIKVEEGPRLKVGKVDVSGDLITSKSKLLAMLQVGRETYFDRELMQNDALAITDMYENGGYAHVNVVPSIGDPDENGRADITYVIDKGKPVYYEKIIIAGNTKTRDKVIRRELTVHELGLFNGTSLKRSVRNLHRLDYFEDVKVDTLPGSADDKVILKLDVEEKSTGAFTFGGGYSSVENAFAMGSIDQKNLFGRGHAVALRAQIGGRTAQYSLSFTEPWLFDIPLSAGIDLYNWNRDYDTYDTDSLGFGFRGSYRIFNYTRAYLSYTYDLRDIRNISPFAPDSVKQLEGSNLTSSITAAIRYDSRDREFNPTEGVNHSLSLQYSGLGGDVGFYKISLESGVYYPLYRKLVAFGHLEGGFVRKTFSDILPDYERFYLGGMNSLRGFDWRDISPTKVNAVGIETQIGGDKFVQFNFELLLPLIEKSGVVLVVFYDTGDVYDNHQRIDFANLRESVGFGFRWYSPMGPIRIEYGYILNSEPGESSGGSWEFTMGNAF